MKYRVFYFYPPFEGEPMSIIVPEDQVEYHDGHFTKTIRRYEAKNWNVQEIKQKEKTNEESQIHPQTGRPVWSIYIWIRKIVCDIYVLSIAASDLKRLDLSAKTIHFNRKMEEKMDSRTESRDEIILVLFIG